MLNMDYIFILSLPFIFLRSLISLSLLLLRLKFYIYCSQWSKAKFIILLILIWVPIRFILLWYFGQARIMDHFVLSIFWMNNSGKCIVLSKVKIIFEVIILLKITASLKIYFLFNERVWRLTKLVLIIHIEFSKINSLDLFLYLVVV